MIRCDCSCISIELFKHSIVVAAIQLNCVKHRIVVEIELNCVVLVTDDDGECGCHCG